MFKRRFKNIDKHTHKFIIWAVIGSAIVGLGIFGKTKKGKKFFDRLKNVFGKISWFFYLGLKELKKTFKKWKK